MQRVGVNPAKNNGERLAPRTYAAQTVICCALRHQTRSSPPDSRAARGGERRNAFSFREDIVVLSVL